jgi:hypothetical protein
MRVLTSLAIAGLDLGSVSSPGAARFFGAMDG